jgi:uncharacterized protein (DUF433 family)
MKYSRRLGSDPKIHVHPSPSHRGYSMAMEGFPGVSMDPEVRIDIATIVGAVAARGLTQTVAAEYASSLEQVRAVLASAAHVVAHLLPAVRRAS